MFRVNGSSPPGHQEFRVPRTAMTAGLMGAVAATVSAALLLSAGGKPEAAPALQKSK